MSGSQMQQESNQDAALRGRQPLRELARRLTRFQVFLTVVGLLLSVLGTLAALLEPWLVGYAIDHLLITRGGEAQATSDQSKKLLSIGIGLAVVVIIRMLCNSGQAYLFEWVGQDLAFRLRQEVFDHVMRLPIPIHDKNPAGRLLTRVANDVASLAEMFSAGFISIITNILMVVGILVGLILLDVKLGLITWAIFPFLFAFAAYFSRKLRLAYREARSRLANLNSFLAENLIGMRVIHLFSREQRQLERFKRINHSYSDAQLGTVRVFALFQPTITLCSGLAMAILISVGGGWVHAGHLKLGILVTFFSYVMAAFQPIREISDKWNTFLSGMVSAERLFGVLDWPLESSGVSVRRSSDNPSTRLALRGEIDFENVWFAYQGERWVLKDFSLKIKAGSQVGIVGHTGAGKTTLLALLLRFYEPTKGRILLDGRDLREYGISDLRRSIGLISQEVHLFSGSLEGNLGLGDRVDAEVWTRLHLAAHEVGFDLEAARNRQTQERGANWSLGERQVLAYLRALAQSPKLWILDEATANIDSDSEARLNREMHRAFQGKTSLLIAHRLSTVRNADLIIVLHQGTLIECGTHEQLILKKGFYSRLYALQDFAISSEMQS